MIIFKMWLYKLSDIDRGTHKHAIRNKYEFLAFLKKKLFRETEKIFTFEYSGLHYAHKT